MNVLIMLRLEVNGDNTFCRERQLYFLIYRFITLLAFCSKSV